MTTVSRDAVRELCTDAVYERGRNYLDDGRIQRLARFDETITAVVSGSREYDLTLDVSSAEFDPQCSCPYDAPGICKHAVAVLLRLADEIPENESDRIDAVLDRADEDELRDFLRDELAADPSLRDRFLAWFGATPSRTTDELRVEIDQLFEETNPDYEVVFDPIDFSEFFDLAEAYRGQEEFRAAATIYRALLEGLDENMNLVDGAYDHYAKTFRSALDGYVDCVVNARLDEKTVSTHVQFLEDRATSGTHHLQKQFGRATDELRERTDAR
jgi:uncharacterized Zn finger protein